jgi:hypothetical protein
VLSGVWFGPEGWASGSSVEVVRLGETRDIPRWRGQVVMESCGAVCLYESSFGGAGAWWVGSQQPSPTERQSSKKKGLHADAWSGRIKSARGLFPPSGRFSF